MVVQKTMRPRLWRHVFLVFAVFLIMNFFAAWIYQHMDNKNYTDSFFTVMSASTLSGYGDPPIESDAAKWFISFYQLFGFGLFFYLLSVVIVTDMEREKIVRR